MEGRLAGCLVGLIADTKTETGRELDDLGRETAPPDLARVGECGPQCATARNWRVVKNAESGSPLEQVEYFRALAEAVDPDQAIAWARAHSLPDRPDWARIVLEIGCSVDAGHAFAQPAISGEIHIMQTTFPGSFGGNGLVADLNQAPSDVVGTGAEPATLTVIDRGMWARYFQRHLCSAIVETGDFLG